MGAVKGKLPLVEKNPQPLGVILRLEEELEKGKNIAIVLFFVAVSKYVTRKGIWKIAFLEFAIMRWANDGN